MTAFASRRPSTGSSTEPPLLTHLRAQVSSAGHGELPRLALAILDLALDLDAYARRHAGITRLSALPPLDTWRPAHRYDPTGTWKDRAADLVNICRLEVERRLTSLVSGGLLTEEVP